MVGFNRLDKNRGLPGRRLRDRRLRAVAFTLPMQKCTLANMSKSDREPSAPASYQLIDFGGGRKLESFGRRLLDRPCPAADGHAKRHRPRWADADSIFHLSLRRWEHRTPWQDEQAVDFGEFSMPVFPTPFGHVGVFPEQAPNWRWLGKTAPDCGGEGSATQPDLHRAGDQDGGPASVLPVGLNLFGYTGASSIVMATSGMQVVHVDAAKQNVSAAKAVAMLNGLDHHPIRYLVDDAAKFAAREVRRQNRYHTIVMDPPAYGHSPRGKAWRLERDLWPLIDDCLALLTPERFRLLITGHSPQVGPADVVDYLARRMPETSHLSAADFDSSVSSGRLTIKDISNRKLDAGFFVRCSFPLADA